jgi:chromosome segregation ATPase
VQLLILQALKATSLEKSVFLCKERDAWTTCENKSAAREAAEGELAKECEISAELRQKCTALTTETREAQEKVAPLEKRVGDLTQESEEQRAAAEGFKGEVARLEALLAEKDLALNQARADLSAAQNEVARWHWSSVENEKRAEGKSCVFSLSPPLFLYICVNFPDFFVFSVLFLNRGGEEDGRGNLCRRGLAEVP